MSDFITAAKNGDLAKVKAMLAADRSLMKVRDSMNNTAFHNAAAGGHESVVSFFIKEGADVHEIGAFGRNVLMRAAESKKDNTQVVKMLVKAGARVNDVAQDEENPYSALYLASKFSQKATLKTLITAGADVHMKMNGGGWQAIHMAAQFGSVEKLEILVQAGASVIAETTGKVTPIIKSAYGNKATNIHFLHQHGGDLDIVDNAGKSALYWACENEFPECVSMLLKLGAKRDIKDKQVKTPLDIAREKKNEEIVEMLEKTDHTPALHEACLQGKLPRVSQLLKSGHSPNEKDGLGRTGLHVATVKKNVALMKLLLKNQADPNERDDDWNCPIHITCLNGFTPALLVLLETADMNEVDQNGCTPIMLAASFANLEVVKLLLEVRGINLKSQDNNANSVLHHAAKGGDMKIMKLLIAYRPRLSLDPLNCDNDTPLVVAAKNNHASIVRLLLLELVPEANVERSLTKFTRSTRGLDESVRILPTNLAIEVVNNTGDEDLVQFVIQYKDEYNL